MVEGWAVAAVGWGWAAVGWAAVGCREEERVEKGWVAVGWAAVGWGEEEREEGGWEGAGWVAERAAAEALKGGTHCWVAEDWGAPALEHMAGVAAAKLAAQCSAAAAEPPHSGWEAVAATPGLPAAAARGWVTTERAGAGWGVEEREGARW
jgi:hypothetical protein